jgi:hypothetical protein
VSAAHTGRCLCGAVRYAIEGPMREVLVCHCGECRRWHGGPGAYTAVPRDALAVTGERDLRWVRSPESVTHASRAFCARCGSSLFWRAPGRDTVSITAGSLDEPTGLRVAGHIHADPPGDWEEPSNPAGSSGL